MFSQSPLLRLSFVALLAITVQARKVTVANLCNAPVWGAYNGLNSEQITVNGKAGTGMWKQESGQEDELDIPETWETGRIWPATGCDASGTNCMVGGCGAAKCDGKSAGQTGATLAEFTFDPKFETYDISIVDGYSVPISIIPTGGTSGECKKVTCGAETDLLSVCDPSLAYPHGSDTVWSCMSPCAAKVQFADSAVMPFDMMTAPVCCPENTPEACPTSTIPFYDVYKPICNDAFLYAPDMNGNVICIGPEYRIEFCPGGKGLGANPKGNAPVAQCAGGELVGGGGAGMNDDGGGSTSGIPEGSGQNCAAGDAGVNEGSGAGSGSGSSDTDAGTAAGSVTGTGTKAAASTPAAAAGTGAAAGTAASGTVEGVATGDAASGGAAAVDAGYFGTTSGTAGTAGAAAEPTVPAPTTGAAVATPAPAPAPTVSGASSAAAVSSAPAATSACRGRECRGGRRPPRIRRQACKRRLGDEDENDEDDEGQDE